MARKDTQNRKQEHSERDVTNRFEESRGLEEREAQKRAVMSMTGSDPLYVDPDVIPHGVEYRWMRESIQDRPDNKRMVEVRRKGWTPVPASRHPDMVYKDFFGRLDHMNAYIYHSGLLLCERPAELGRLEMQRIADHNHQVMTSMPGTDNFMGEPGIPVRNNSETSMSRAARVT